MPHTNMFSPQSVPRDLVAGTVVFLVALPLCLGIAIASKAPPIAGLLAGIVGGLVVGAISRSHVSVSGPAAGLTLIVATQIKQLGTFEAFLLAVVVAGAIQIALGALRLGFLAAYIPSCVIKGLLAAIGITIILKFIPHLFGHDVDPIGEMSFLQPFGGNTFSEFIVLLSDVHATSAVIGLTCFAVLLIWEKAALLRKSPVPSALVVVLLGVAMSLIAAGLNREWAVAAEHLVKVPVTKNLSEAVSLLCFPDFSQWTNPAVYLSGLIIAMVATLETLLNLEAVDKLDPRQRTSPPNRELIAQGVGNTVVGLVGGIPVTSVIVRSSVNINAGGRTKLSAIFHAVLLLLSVLFLPTYLNLIPLSALAAILIVTGFKLTSPKIMAQLWNAGWSQFIPFATTIVAIIFTDLIIGVLIGLAVSVGFILSSNLRRPVYSFFEKFPSGEVLHIELPNQVSFLNRAALDQALDLVPRGHHVLIDALNSDYIDADILDMIRDYRDQKSPVRGITVSLIGFDRFGLDDQVLYTAHTTRELQDTLSPAQVLDVLKDGHERFKMGKRLTRNLGRQVNATAKGQHPLAVLLSCIDSRTPGELIFDLGVGDILSVRIAGNIVSRKVIGSLEYGCAVAGAKLIVVMGHTRCGAVTAAVDFATSRQAIVPATGCQHLEYILRDIQESVPDSVRALAALSEEQRQALIDDVARQNVLNTVRRISEQSETLRRLVQENKVLIVGMLYDVANANIEYLPIPPPTPTPDSVEEAHYQET